MKQKDQIFMIQQLVNLLRGVLFNLKPYEISIERTKKDNFITETEYHSAKNKISKIRSEVSNELSKLQKTKNITKKECYQIIKFILESVKLFSLQDKFMNNIICRTNILKEKLQED